MRAFLWSLLPLGALVVLLLFNLTETDRYDFGVETPTAPGNNVDAEDAAFSRVFPELKFVHACAGCGECVHRFEIVENRRVLTLHDHDGWYKVFWAADDTYYYSDPVHLIADWGQNRTAEAPAGTWSIRLRAGAPTHASGAAHDCGQLPREIALEYVLDFSESPLDETFHSGDGPLKILKSFAWLVTNPGKPVSLGWKLSGPPRVVVEPCACSKP
jgi:hypothetical protein